MTTHTYEEARSHSLKYFNGDSLAAEVFAGKYALRDLQGNLCELTPADMHRRMAKEFARIESKYPSPMSESEIYELFDSWKVVPQGSPMSAIGNPYQFQSLSNCFVIESPQDSYGGILRADQEQAQIMKRRGGVGFDVSTIRPRGLTTLNAARTTDGIGIFMERFSNTCREVAQGGRRGALMLTISVHHPEIRTFINIKRDLKRVTGANISIRLSDEFMNAVKDGAKVQLRFPVEKDVPHIIEEEVSAVELWNEIIEAAHASAEPGLLFWDTVTRMGPADAYASAGYGSTSTNPCGEITLSPYDSCRLLLVNLYAFVKNPFTAEAHFDYEDFGKVVYKAQRLMDDLVDLELEAVDRILEKIDNDPEDAETKRIETLLWQKIKKAAIGGRRTGLGITALGDALAATNVVYGSSESVAETDKIYMTQALSAYTSTVDMAELRGAFPVFSHDLEKGHPFIERILALDNKLRAKYVKFGRRNIALTTTAPAGSVSILTQTTSGCEPVFMLSYKRRRKITANDGDARVDFVDDLGDKWQEYTVYHHAFKKWMDVTGLSEADIAKSPYFGATSNDIDWVKKIDVQAAAQKWICHSISNTTNIPSATSVDIVKQIYMHGWVTGCKGVTIYREGSRAGVLVSDPPQKTEPKIDGSGLPVEVLENHAPKRPKELPCDIHRATVKGETYLVLVGLHKDKPYEIFCGLQQYVEVPKKIKSGTLMKNGKVDGVATYNLKFPLGDDDELVFKNIVELFDNPIYGALTRTISLALRHGVPLQYLIEQLRKDKHSDITSFSACIARVLSKHYIPDGTKAIEKTCRDCGGANLHYVQGCVTCFDCGGSKCG
jgi:ribonucleoside-diphosphate reductase alpha chain